jgi:hypothetical protein
MRLLVLPVGAGISPGRALLPSIKPLLGDVAKLRTGLDQRLVEVEEQVRLLSAAGEAVGCGFAAAGGIVIKPFSPA